MSRSNQIDHLIPSEVARSSSVHNTGKRGVAAAHIYLRDAAGELGVPVTFSSGNIGATRQAGSSSSPGSDGGNYELHDFAGNVRNTATNQTSPHEDRDSLDLSVEEPRSPSFAKAMSRVPLLVRSSPAQGTGKLRNALVMHLNAFQASFRSLQ